MEWGLDTAIRGANQAVAADCDDRAGGGFGALGDCHCSAEAGHEIEGPMAIVILGGLVTSTVLNLLVLPTLALRYERFHKPALESQLLPST